MTSKINRFCNLARLFEGYIKNKIRDVPQSQQPITVRQLSGTTVRECRSMPAVLIQFKVSCQL